METYLLYLLTNLLTTKLNFNGKDIKVEITYIYNFNQIENHIGYLDTDNSGTIDFQEFSQLIKNQQLIKSFYNLKNNLINHLIIKLLSLMQSITMFCGKFNRSFFSVLII